MLLEPSRGVGVEIDGTLKDLASEIGLTHEALYRALHDLEAEGQIARRGRSSFTNAATIEEGEAEISVHMTAII